MPTFSLETMQQLELKPVEQKHMKDEVSCFWPTSKVLPVLALRSEEKKWRVSAESITMATADPVKESSMQETKRREQNRRETMLRKCATAWAKKVLNNEIKREKCRNK